MTELTRQEKIDLVNQLIAHKRDIDNFHKKFDELFGVKNGFIGSSDGHYKVFDRLFSDYILMVARQIGETKDGIEWFICENDCGEKGMEAAPQGGKLTPICDADDYVDLVESYVE